MSAVLRRLSRTAASELIEVAEATRDLAEVTEQLLRDGHPRLTWPAIGGARITFEQLTELRQELLAIAGDHGYPEQPTRLPLFDARAAVVLREHLDLTPHEAAQDDAWTYLTCCWLLDITVWRWRSRTPTDKRRFIGDVNRNTWRRLWWRAEQLHPHVDLRQLGEDELVNLTERPTLAANRLLLVVLAQEFLALVGEDVDVSRSHLMRESAKRLLRRMPVMDFQAIPDETLRYEVKWSLEAARASLKGAAIPPRVYPVLAQAAVSPSVQRVSVISDEATAGAISSSDVRTVILEFTERVGRVTNSDLRQLLDISSTEASTALGRHVEEGLLLRRGAKRGTYYVLAGAASDRRPEDGGIDGSEALEEPLPREMDMPAHVVAEGVSASTLAGSRSDGDRSDSDGRSSNVDGVDRDGGPDEANGTGNDSPSASPVGDGDPDVHNAVSSDPVDRTPSATATEHAPPNYDQQQSFTGRRNASVIRRLLRRDR